MRLQTNNNDFVVVIVLCHCLIDEPDDDREIFLFVVSRKKNRIFRHVDIVRSLKMKLTIWFHIKLVLIRAVTDQNFKKH